MVRAGWIVAVDALAAQRGIDINNHIDTDSIENARTFVVVNAWVDVVDADRVDLVLALAGQFHIAGVSG